MTDVNKTEMALRVIAGLTPAWTRWRLFFEDDPVPLRGDKHDESMAAYQSRISIQVRLKACEWLADRIVLDPIAQVNAVDLPGDQ